MRNMLRHMGIKGCELSGLKSALLITKLPSLLLLHCNDPLFLFILACGGSLSGNGGVFSSPSYPSIYPNNKDCTWNLVGNAGERIRLSFVTFDLQDNFVCSNDYVEVNEVLNLVLRLDRSNEIFPFAKSKCFQYY